ncbi:MAG TPA: UDP-N-acetylmuramate dehydrogenase [Thermomicrobiales bacterium]|nr:UDP-N-acetylmuramate dehydrogenase [Thermomicrobiales bacterium]
MSARTKPKTPPIEVTENDITISLQKDARSDLYSTFRVGGPTDFLVRAGTAGEIGLAYRWAHENDLPVTIFGGGSNLLVSDKGVRGLTILVRRPGKDAEGGLEILAEDDASVTIRVPAFAPSNWLGRTAAERGWAGMAWLVGLPGNVGGAIVNNAGAHGGEMTDHLLSLRMVDSEGSVIERERDWLEPAYRYTRLKHAPRPRELVVVDGTFRFERGDAAALKAEADEYGAYRDQSQPTGACAGSIFKNPEGDYSGAIVERCGLKGTRVGGAVVSEKHANFIVNDAGATAADIVGLMTVVREAVQKQTGILLEPEIERIGDWS